MDGWRSQMVAVNLAEVAEAVEVSAEAVATFEPCWASVAKRAVVAAADQRLQVQVRRHC